MKHVKFINSTEQQHVSNIICIGQNYSEHIKEMGNEKPEFPVVFMKPSTALIQSGEKVIHPDYSDNLHHEVELVLLIGKPIKNANMEEAEKAILAYGVGLDMTLRDLQHKARENGDPWTICKGFDTSAVVSEFIKSENRPLTGNESLLLTVNDEVRQNTSISDMIFNPVEVVKYLSSKITLETGTLLFTGTPKGVGKVVPGDKLNANLEKLVYLETEISN